MLARAKPRSPCALCTAKVPPRTELGKVCKGQALSTGCGPTPQSGQQGNQATRLLRPCRRRVCLHPRGSRALGFPGKLPPIWGLGRSRKSGGRRSGLGRLEWGGQSPGGALANWCRQHGDRQESWRMGGEQGSPPTPKAGLICPCFRARTLGPHSRLGHWVSGQPGQGRRRRKRHLLALCVSRPGTKGETRVPSPWPTRHWPPR